MLTKFYFAATSKQSLERYKALHDYVPENDDELALKQGDIVLVTDKDVCEGWWEGTSNNKSGVFPNNFVEPAPLQVEEIPKDKVNFVIVDDNNLNSSYRIEFERIDPKCCIINYLLDLK